MPLGKNPSSRPGPLDRNEAIRQLRDAKLAERMALMERDRRKEEMVNEDAKHHPGEDFDPEGLDIAEPFTHMADHNGRVVLNARGKPFEARMTVDQQYSYASLLAEKKGYKLKLDYAHRTAREQQILWDRGMAERTRMWNNPKGRKEQNLVREAKAKYASIKAWNRAMVAPAGHSPHETGGAIDVWAVPIGEEFSEKHKDPKSEHIKVLQEVMLAAGFAPYDEEPWHWSIGDKRWAEEKGVERSLTYNAAKRPFYGETQVAGN